MVVFCEECERHYDDARLWTICPHNPIHRSPDDRVCKRHDLFDCRCPADKVMIALRAREVDLPRTYHATPVVATMTGLPVGDAYKALVYLRKRGDVEATNGGTIDGAEININVGFCWRISEHALKARR